MTVVKERKVMQEVSYYVFARNGKVVSAVNIVGTNKVNARLSKETDLSASTLTLALEEINKIMESVLEKKEEGYAIGAPMKIRTLNSLVNAINTGNFKYWVRSGQYANGNLVPERDVKAWTRFIELYSKLYADINFNKQSIAKRYHNDENSVERGIINTLWEQLPKESKLESIGSDDDLNNIIF